MDQWALLTVWFRKCMKFLNIFLVIALKDCYHFVYRFGTNSSIVGNAIVVAPGKLAVTFPSHGCCYLNTYLIMLELMKILF